MGNELDTPRAAWRDGPALAFALLYPAAMTWVYFVVMHQEGAGDNPGLRAAYGVGKAVQFLFPVVYVGVFERARLRPRPPTRGGLLAGVGFGLLVAGAMGLLYFGALRASPWFANTPAAILSRLQQMGLTGPAGFLALAVFYCVVHSWLEEYYWRWFIFGTLARYLPPAGAMIVSGLGFALHHFVILAVYFPNHVGTLALPLALGVAVGGVFWAWLYHAAGSLYAAWVSHLLIDAAIMTIGYTMLAPYWG
jgi:uncharacterized protein